MSLERRQYNARQRFDATTVEAAPTALDWDEEAQVRAIEEARASALRDPYASQALAAQVMAQPARVSLQQYDPPKLYAQMRLVSGMTFPEIEQMHFLHFFGQVREITLAKEREYSAYTAQT